MPDISYSWLLWRLGIRSSHFILLFLLSPFEHRTERDIALEQHCKSLCQSLTSDHAVGQFRRLLSVVVKCRGNDGLRRSTQQPALQLHDAGIKHDRSAKNRMESGHGDKISGDMTPNSPKPTVAVSSLVPVRIAHQASGALEPTSFTSDSPVLSDGGSQSGEPPIPHAMANTVQPLTWNMSIKAR